jgi:hypothetical protein
VLRDHFGRFAAEYDSRYAKDLGNFRLERISRVTTRFLTCGDYRQGVARIRCVNPKCRHEYFRPFSCKGFYLCPSCSQKRTLLFAEYLDEQLLLALPHRQFVFTLPKALRVFLRHDQRLFANLARLIFSPLAAQVRQGRSPSDEEACFARPRTAAATPAGIRTDAKGAWKPSRRPDTSQWDVLLSLLQIPLSANFGWNCSPE